MTQGFIDPNSDFASIIEKGAAGEWGKRAIELAKAEGVSVDRHSLDQWLRKAELESERQLRTTAPELYRNRLTAAAVAAEQIASVEGLWQ